MSEAQKTKEETIDTPTEEAVAAEKNPTTKEESAEPAEVKAEKETEATEEKVENVVEETEVKAEKTKKSPPLAKKTASNEETPVVEETAAPEAVTEDKPAAAAAEPVVEETAAPEAVTEDKPAAAAAEPVVEETTAPEAVTEDKPVEAVAEPVEAEEDPFEAKDENAIAKEEKPKKTDKEVLEEEEFDWDAIDTKGFGEGYSKKQIEDLENLYDGTLNTITEGEVVKATVVSMSARDVILNIGFKSDGLVSASEFRDLPDLKAGDEVEVYIEEQENAQGQLVLSRRKAKIVSAWEHIKASEADDKVIESMVKRRTKGGLIVDIFGVEAFLPGSQIDVKPIRDFDIFVGKSMEVKVVKINYTNDNVVVSHKVLIEKDLEAQRTEILTNLEKGQVLEGVIKNMTTFGVFIDLGGVDGLLHITDISWGRINHPEDVLKLDATVKIVVLDFDEDKKRISLGMKQLTPHPWDSLPEDIEIGSKIKGKIVNVADYGAFLELQSGVEGLIHVSEMSWSQHLRNPSDFLEVGAEMEAVVLTIDREERKMSLGIKQLTEDPWTKTDVAKKYAVGTEHKGVVRNLTNFGLFIELEEGIDGLVHISDLSWTKKIKHPSEFVAVGDELAIQVLELDIENRRLALGHKQLEENPWDTFETVFEPGSVHKCTIINKTDKGATLELPYGIEGFCTVRNLVKEDESKAEAGETLDFKVVEFSKGDKRILLSHTSTFKEEEKHKKRAPKKSNVKNQEATSSLGDFEALSNLKDQMSDAPAKKAPAKAAPAATAKKEEVKEEPIAEAVAQTVEEEAPAEKEKKKPAAKSKAKKEDVKEEVVAETAEAEAPVEKEEKKKPAAKAKAKKEEKVEKPEASAESEESAEDK